MKNRNVMIDLETMGTRPGCALLSIGAVDFGKEGVGDATFYEVVSLQDCLDRGLAADPQTQKWWEGQSKEARDVLRRAGLKRAPKLAAVLQRFRRYYHGVSVDARAWGNGADFDLPILAAAYASVGQDPPWSAYSGRCYRTLKHCAPRVKLERSGTHHNALDDARTQAEHAVRLAKRLRVEL